MQIKEAKIRFDAGLYKSSQVVEALMGSGYHLTLLGNKRSDDAIVTSQRGGEEPRLFKTIDAAAKNAKEVGFRKVEVAFSS